MKINNWLKLKTEQNRDILLMSFSLFILGFVLGKI